eukprot:6465375-Amphidinium_carterae.2
MPSCPLRGGRLLWVRPLVVAAVKPYSELALSTSRECGREELPRGVDDGGACRRGPSPCTVEVDAGLCPAEGRTTGDDCMRGPHGFALCRCCVARMGAMGLTGGTVRTGGGLIGGGGGGGVLLPELVSVRGLWSLASPHNSQPRASLYRQR